jgi:lipopolysaccharide export system permease protein
MAICAVVMRILDRYILRNFIEPFLLCLSAFIGLLIIADLFDNAEEFIAAKASFKVVAGYYASQMPHFLLLSMPLGLLLGLLYCLSKMSRSNEVISILTAGRSVIRLLMPLIVFGSITTAGCIALNYELAPHADAIRRADLERMKKGAKKADQIGITNSLLVKDRRTNRLWYARRIRPAQNTLEDVHISQLDADGKPRVRWYAGGAIYDARNRTWVLNYGRMVTFKKDGDVDQIDDWSSSSAEKKFRSITGWSETPQRLASSTMQPDQLSVPELESYLDLNSDFPSEQLAPYRTHWHYRWALPISCLAVVFIAAPLGIVFSRRAVLASVAGSIFIFFIFLMSMFLFLALGKGGHVPPWMGGWTPNIALFSIGGYLLYLRSTNREFPKLSFKK